MSRLLGSLRAWGSDERRHEEVEEPWVLEHVLPACGGLVSGGGQWSYVSALGLGDASEP